MTVRIEIADGSMGCFAGKEGRCRMYVISVKVIELSAGELVLFGSRAIPSTTHARRCKLQPAAMRDLPRELDEIPLLALGCNIDLCLSDQSSDAWMSTRPNTDAVGMRRCFRLCLQVCRSETA